MTEPFAVLALIIIAMMFSENSHLRQQQRESLNILKALMHHLQKQGGASE